MKDIPSKSNLFMFPSISSYTKEKEEMQKNLKSKLPEDIKYR
jgi:hypothetical protein